ncbi:VOC family protein [Halalkalicoccus jeotgali]|uniref:Glyoxalase/bleomycin resistance protein/dioxygenase n=1 Tax=Halalkalicoccus jeotgali (strain DSM 18796 / CECT 7217 / JCM 14584 / KCTC 4019 / B3) TaxID=795797 RepID=D8J9E3_HALJB|nr:VOC family protein [Halalkalicoccus jeotgali]ADJ14355.1 Glyoxalase/bleomycin resistance protein/dioxygenase [Halalkalicoccus jeotgali B3]ELY40617.1 Glyoxalase/bleomycin resistance protein/dioxygenase [Halalkalicoccus jeotgali B3]
MDAVDHINVDVTDLANCYEFYHETLGLELLRPPEDFQGAHAMFRAGSTVLTLVETGHADGWAERGLDHPLDKAHIAFEAPRGKYDALSGELDGQFPKQGPYDWVEFEGFYFLDPDGNLLEVITYDPPAGERERPLLTHDDVE